MKYKKITEQYFIAETCIFKPISGTEIKFDGFKNFEFFQNKDGDIYEAHTGRAIYYKQKEQLREEIIKQAMVELHKHLHTAMLAIVDILSVSTAEGFRMALKEHLESIIKTDGLSPRYEEI